MFYCVYFKEKRKNGELLVLTLQRLFRKVIFEAIQPSEDNKKGEVAHFKAHQISLII